MKIFTRLFMCAVLCSLSFINADAQAPGDTINVQTFFFGSSQDSFFVFPPDTNRYEKILMHYKLKCNPAQSPACGEWDYLTYSYLWDHTGVNDSTLQYQPSYVIDGNSPDSIQFMTSPSYSYFPVWHTHLVYDSLISMDTAAVGSGSVVSPQPFGSAQQQSRTQYLWKASELLAAGMQPGNITSLRFNLQSTGSAMQNFVVRMKHTSLNALTASSFERTGLALSFSDDISFSSTGWQTINLTYPFNWDGTSNLVIDIAFTNSAAGTDNNILAENTSFSSGVFSSGDDRSLFWYGPDHAEVPTGAFSSLDSFVTVAFWCYGNPTFQPQDQSFIEGFDSGNHRVLNIHLPWSNSNVYWDAGNSNTGTYDRLNTAIPLSSFAGEWNHWAFVKNVATGRMKIYRNGSLLIQATAKTKRMYGITNFKLGSAWNGNISYDGNIEEFAMWNAELDSNTLKSYMYRDLDAGHPFNSNLLLYYHCNDQSFTTIADAGAGAYYGTLVGPPTTRQIGGENLFRNFQATTERPNIVFEQGVYVEHLDSVLVIDSVANEPFMIVQYNNVSSPTIPTDTIIVWAAYYNQYQYDSTGTAVDSMFVTPDSTFYLAQHPYYNVFEVINRYEIGRFITPYGNGLNLGAGFTWTYDVTDYASLLHDTVHLSSGNWQELLDVRFEMIRGIPPRDAYKVENLWVGNPQLYNIETFLTPKTVFIDSAAVNTRYKMRTTGHWFGGLENCAEFCIKHNYLFVDGIQRWDTIVWRNNCSSNPLYPQGGTWIYNRTNWCPGSDVPTYDFELTPYAAPGDSVMLDYNVESYAGGGGPNYVIETQLVSYGAPNFTLDAGVWDIKAPSKADIYKRMNPICTKPIVTVRNGGTATLTSLTITYGVEGGPQSTFNWTGNLAFLKTEDVTLPPFAWSSGNKFTVTLSNPNGGTDEYPNNNTMKSDYNFPPKYDADLIFDLLTDAHYDQYGFNQGSYTIKDETGTIIHQRSNLSPNVLYKDTLHLADGCYEFRFIDDVIGATNPLDPDYNYGDGMTNWPDQTNVPVGHMWFRRASNGSIIKSFGMDFGREMYQQFTVGYYLDVEDQVSEDGIYLYPNPSTGIFNLDMAFAKEQDVSIMVTDMFGRKIYSETLKNIFVKNVPLDLTGEPNGIYFVVVQSKDKRMVRKLVKQN